MGAGVAGLAAAGRLAEAGLHVAVLEARDRIGGRVHTLHDALSPLPIELGAEFVHGTSRGIWDLIDAGPLAVNAVTGEHQVFRDGRLGESAGDMQGVFDPLMAYRGPDISFAEFLRTCDCDGEVKRWATAYVEGFNAADHRRIGVHALIRQQHAEDASGGDASFRLPGGYSQIPQALARKIPAGAIHLGAHVESIHWSEGRVSISVAAFGTVTARHAIVTVPLPLLTQIRFHPEPADALHAASRIAMGGAVRIVFLFRERFWEEREQPRGVSFLHSLENRFPTWWTQSPVRAPLLTAWTGGPKSLAAGGRREALDSLSRILSYDRGRLDSLTLKSYSHDWLADPYSQGAYTYLPAGALDAPERLAAPVRDTLFFAGEATESSGHYGTVHGAIASGIRAAGRILHPGAAA